MARKIRKDITVGSLEKKLGVAPGTITNPDGSDARSDKKLETLQKEQAKALKATSKRAPAKKPATTASRPKAKTTTTAAAKKKRGPTVASATRPKVDPTLVVTADQQTAARRTIKSHPKSAALVNKLRIAMAAKKKS